MPLFDVDADYLAFERVLGAAVSRFRVALYAYCVMPNHWHLVIMPLAEGELSRFMHWLTTTHARRWQLARGLDGMGAVYQGRFKAIPVESDRSFLWVCRYVERNALRANVVVRAEDWRWCSLSRESAERVCIASWPVGRPADWIEHVNRPQTAGELEAFRRAMHLGEPFGSDTWRVEIEQALGMRRGRRGRPNRSPRGCPQQMTPDPLTNM